MRFCDPISRGEGYKPLTHDTVDPGSRSRRSLGRDDGGGCRIAPINGTSHVPRHTRTSIRVSISHKKTFCEDRWIAGSKSGDDAVGGKSLQKNKPDSRGLVPAIDVFATLATQKTRMHSIRHLSSYDPSKCTNQKHPICDTSTVPTRSLDAETIKFSDQSKRKCPARRPGMTTDTLPITHPTDHCWFYKTALNAIRCQLLMSPTARADSSAAMS